MLPPLLLLLEALGLAANERPDLELSPPSLWPRTIFPNLLEEVRMCPCRLELLLFELLMPPIPLPEFPLAFPELPAVLWL